VRRYVDMKDAEAQGMDEITFNAGIFRSRGDDDTRKVKFIGRLLAEAETYHGQTSDGRDRGTNYFIYQTKAGKIIIRWKNWSRWENENDTADYAVYGDIPSYDDDIFGKVLDLGPERLPGDLLQDAAEALGKEMVEYID